MVQIMAFVTGRLFVGTSLSRKEDWRKLSIRYTIDAFDSAAALRRWNPWLRHFVKHFLPEVRRVWQDFSDATKWITPVIKQRIVDENLDDYKKPNDSIQWMLDALPASAKEDFAFQARGQLGLSAAAIHTTGNLATYVMLDLAARPEYMEILRQEVKDVVGDKFDGKFTTDAMNEYG